MNRVSIAVVSVMIGLMGCGENEPFPPQPTSTPTQTPTRTPTPTATPIPTLGPGANIGFFGILRADNTLVNSIRSDAAGRPVFTRDSGFGFFVVIDAKPGTNHAAVGRSTLDSDPADPTKRPDLQIEASRTLGDGDPVVCKGGVPGVDPPSFAEGREISDRLNDLGCLFDDGARNHQGVTQDSACVMFLPAADFGFVDPTATLEFCTNTITRAARFPVGDTILTARVRDASGMVGPERQIVIRIGGTP